MLIVEEAMLVVSESTLIGRSVVGTLGAGEAGRMLIGVTLDFGDGVRGEVGTVEGGRGHGLERMESGRALSLSLETAGGGGKMAGGGEVSS